MDSVSISEERERRAVHLARPTILAFAPNEWSGPWMNRQQLLSRLAARGWPTYYSTGALSHGIGALAIGGPLRCSGHASRAPASS